MHIVYQQSLLVRKNALNHHVANEILHHLVLVWQVAFHFYFVQERMLETLQNQSKSTDSNFQNYVIHLLVAQYLHLAARRDEMYLQGSNWLVASHLYIEDREADQGSALW